MGEIAVAQTSKGRKLTVAMLSDDNILPSPHTLGEGGGDACGGGGTIFSIKFLRGFIITRSKRGSLLFAVLSA